MTRFYLFLFILLFSTTQSYAFSVQPWFENINQRAARLLAEKKYMDAEKTFTRTDWKAIATYRGKSYAKASEQFKNLGGELGFYNQGNALAYLGQYQKAIQSYEKALKINPKNEDAIYNRDLLKKLLEDNKQDQDKQDQDQDQDQDQGQDEDKQDQKQQDQDKREQDQKQKDQEKQDQDQKQHDQEQQDQDQKQQDQDQALRLVPDDPGGLLREKFWRDHWRRLKTERP